MAGLKFIGISLALAGIVTSTLVTPRGRFFPETGGIQKSKLLDPISIPYDVAASQTSNVFSYWTSSFITSKDDREYLLLSHTITNFNMYRASVIDLSDPNSFTSFTVTNAAKPTTKNGTLYLDYGDFGFANTSPDPLGQFNTWSTRSDVNYNITIDMSTALMLNGGNGAFTQTPAANISSDPSTTEEWAMPAGLTRGSFVAPSGEKVEVDPLRSFTWYDRQWGNLGCTGPEAAANWTWFELTLGSEVGVVGSKYSIWFYPWGETGDVKGMATVRHKMGEHTVVPATFTQNGPYWKSPNSNVVYSLGWTVEFADGLTLNITSIAENQELFSADLTQIAYEGFVDVEVTRKDGSKFDGFGLVEVVPVESD